MTPSTVAPGTAPQDGSGEMFDRIAGRYDRLNRILSVGLDAGWRRAAARALDLSPGDRVLDLATGTGDLALTVAATWPGVEIDATDPSAKMLAVAVGKIAYSPHAGRIHVVRGDATTIDASDGGYAGVTMAFGIRNVNDRLGALREMRRVTRRGGRIAILELAEPERGILGALARFHIHSVVPRVGAWLSGEREYRYLQRSIAAFPPASEFADMIRAAGLRVLEVQSLTLGVATLFVATPEGEPA